LLYDKSYPNNHTIGPSTITYQTTNSFKEARDLDLAVNDRANADDSPAWMFKPLPSKHSNAVIDHPLLVVDIQAGCRMASTPSTYINCC